MGGIKQGSRRFSVSCIVYPGSQAAILHSKYQLLSDWSHPSDSIPDPAASIFAIMDPDEGKI